MATMTEFKFNCPACGQHILAEAAWVGSQINCPSCKKTITIPAQGRASENQSPPPETAAPAEPKLSVTAALEKPQGKNNGASVSPTAPPLPSRAETHATEAAAPAPQPKPEPAASPAKSAEEPQVAVLSPAVKLDIVRAIRRRFDDEANWLPGRVDGATAYAAKMKDGKPVLLDATSPEATRFSLMGAFLFEMAARRVVRTAVGRKRLLDEEIPEAVGEVLLEHAGEEERDHAEEVLAGRDLLGISHAQCLAVLDLLEARYSQRMEERRIERAKRTLGSVRLPELVNKLEKKIGIAPEEVATALYHELMEVRRRLENVERRLSVQKPKGGQR